MSTFRRVLAGASIAIAAAAAPAQAQVAFGLAGGATLPSGDLNDRQNLGYNGLATLQLGLPTVPLQLRADLQYNSFGGKNFVDAFNTAVDGADTRVISGSINAVFNLLTGPIKPYAIGGIGYYDTQLKGTESSRKVGYNYGGGVKFGLTGASIFVEARVHQVNESVFNVGAGRSTARFIPITIGIMF
ncbi:MAG: outer membrane beta-barrel protein [Gemmatimonadaceae bacterium]|nr:outer membrane beta-barrel protein [Gemmatimonadaceae bacterium]